IAISAFAAVAGVVFAGIQTFLPSSAPINVMLSVDPTSSISKIGATDVAEEPVNIAKKADGTGEPALQLAALELDGRVTVSDALKDERAGRYAYRDLFDDRPDTFVTIEAPETEINVLVDLPQPEMIGGIEYSPPRYADGLTPAAVLDVMVLPETE